MKKLLLGFLVVISISANASLEYNVICPEGSKYDNNINKTYCVESMLELLNRISFEMNVASDIDYSLQVDGTAVVSVSNVRGEARTGQLVTADFGSSSVYSKAIANKSAQIFIEKYINELGGANIITKLQRVGFGSRSKMTVQWVGTARPVCE